MEVHIKKLHERKCLIELLARKWGVQLEYDLVWVSKKYILTSLRSWMWIFN